MESPRLDEVLTRLAQLERKEAERVRRQRRLLSFGAALALVGTAAWAAVPHTFAIDTPALAAQVNANFTDLDTRLIALDSSLQALNAAVVARVPTGTIALFGGGTCPAGWTEFTPARGRALVGLPQGGTQQGTVGTALTNLANPVHSHEWSSLDFNLIWFSYDAAGNPVNVIDWGDGMDSNGSGTYPFSSDNGGRNFYTSRSSSNFPYIQLLLCSRN